MESRKAEHITWTVKEAMEVLLEEAKRKGVVLPPNAVPDYLQFKADTQNADGTRGGLTLTVVAPLPPKVGISLVPDKPGEA